MKLETFWCVTKPTELSIIEDICFETTPLKMHLQFKGGLTREEVIGYYTTEKEALAVAKQALKNR